jgi:hypothetical protein
VNLPDDSPSTRFTNTSFPLLGEGYRVCVKFVMVQTGKKVTSATSSAATEPVKSSVRGKPWKMSAKKSAKVAAKPAVVEEAEEEEDEEEIVADEPKPTKDISKVKRKRSKDAHQRRRELAKTKAKDKKKADSVNDSKGV